MQAQASAFLVGTPIASITLDSGGSGYKSAPTVYFDIYGIAGGASVTAVLAGRGVDHIEILSPVGAINPMTLVISGGGGSGATADAVFETARIDETNTTPMTSGVATWQWVNPPSGVPVVFGIVNDSSPSGPIHGRSYYSVPAGHLNFPAIANPPDYSEGGWLSPFANPAEGNADPSNLNQTVLGQAWGDSGWSSGADIIIAGNFFGIVGWYSGIPQAVIDEKLVYRWQRRGIIGSGNTYIEQEYPVRVNAIIKTYSWGRGSVFTPGTYPYFRPSVLINTRRVDITEMASYIVEPPAPQVGYEDGGYCTCTFEYVCDQGMAVAPGLASYP